MKDTLTLAEAAAVFAAMSKVSTNLSELLSLASTGRLSTFNARVTCDQIERDLVLVQGFIKKVRQHTEGGRG